jgi:hypothetical protein
MESCQPTNQNIKGGGGGGEEEEEEEEEKKKKKFLWSVYVPRAVVVK